jgi:hypothetical protein
MWHRDDSAAAQPKPLTNLAKFRTKNKIKSFSVCFGRLFITSCRGLSISALKTTFSNRMIKAVKCNHVNCPERSVAGCQASYGAPHFLKRRDSSGYFKGKYASEDFNRVIQFPSQESLATSLSMFGAWFPERSTLPTALAIFRFIVICFQRVSETFYGLLFSSSTSSPSQDGVWHGGWQ